MSETLNLAKLKKGNANFEISVNPEKAMDFKKGKASIEEALQFSQIFSDLKKGLHASEEAMQKNFNTTNTIEIAKQIILEGEIQLTSDYRKKVQEQKKKQIITFISVNGINPKTNSPHPPNRIESALDEAKINIDGLKSVEEQVKNIVPKLQVIIPIKFVVKEIEVQVPSDYAGKACNPIKQFGKVIKENWNNDGSWHALIEIPGGLEQEFYDKLNKLTHGSAEVMVKTVK